MENLTTSHRAHLRRRGLLSESDDLRELREQAARIRANRALQARGMINDVEKDRLRREIRDAGEIPVA